MAIAQTAQPQREYVIEVLDDVAETSGLPAAQLELAVLAVLEHVAAGMERGHLSASPEGIRAAVDAHRAPRRDQTALFEL